MPKKKIKKIIIFIRDFLAKHKIKTAEIILFGSYAKRSASENSDVDIAIVSKSFDKKDIFQRSKMLKGLDWSLVKKFMLPFDIIPLSLNEWQESSSPIVTFVKECNGNKALG